MSADPDLPAPLSPLSKAWRFATLLARPALTRKLGTLVTEGYLERTGWVRATSTGRIQDRRGQPIPWMSYPFVDFIAPRLHAGVRVFEYGAGASTLFFAARVGEVLSVEDDAAFAAALRPRLPANARMIEYPRDSADYARAVTQMANPPHLVVLDGFQRDACAAAALPVLARDGVFVLDDAEREEYAPIYARLRSAGFRELGFWGLAPTRIERRCTAVFYRSENVLGI